MKLEAGMCALVTGASRGLGVEIARKLAERGLDLILAARSVAALEAVAAELRVAGGRKVVVLSADVADAAAIARLVGEVARRGGVDILVNNAGVESSLRFVDRSPAEIVQTIAVNLTAPMLLTRALLPGMLARGRGHVVNIASVAGVLAVPFNEPYSATKFGVVGFTRSLRQTAQASGWPVSASVVCPGFIDGAGLFEDLKREHGVSPEGLGVAPLADMGPAVIRAIEEDLPDIFVTAGNPRQFAAFSIVDPPAFEAAALGSASTAMFRAVADARGVVAASHGRSV